MPPVSKASGEVATDESPTWFVDLSAFIQIAGAFKE